MKPGHKKKYHQKAKNLRETSSGFTKSDFSFLETTLGFTIICHFSKIAAEIAVRRVNLARFQNENVDVFGLLTRFQITNVPKSAICRSARVNFYPKMLRYKLGIRLKIAENAFFFVFEKQHSTGA